MQHLGPLPYPTLAILSIPHLAALPSRTVATTVLCGGTRALFWLSQPARFRRPIASRRIGSVAAGGDRGPGGSRPQGQDECRISRTMRSQRCRRHLIFGRKKWGEKRDSARAKSIYGRHGFIDSHRLPFRAAIRAPRRVRRLGGQHNGLIIPPRLRVVVVDRFGARFSAKQAEQQKKKEEKSWQCCNWSRRAMLGDITEGAAWRVRRRKGAAPRGNSTRS